MELFGRKLRISQPGLVPRGMGARPMVSGAFSVALCLVALAGCQANAWRGQEPDPNGAPSAHQNGVPFASDIPYEKAKVTLPTYTVEPPDILLIEVIKLVPK